MADGRVLCGDPDGLPVMETIREMADPLSVCDWHIVPFLAAAGGEWSLCYRSGCGTGRQYFYPGAGRRRLSGGRRQQRRGKCGPIQDRAFFKVQRRGNPGLRMGDPWGRGSSEWSGGAFKTTKHRRQDQSIDTAAPKSVG